MRLQLERPVVFFDVETTGLDPQTDRIIELAAVKLFPDGREEVRCRRFNPLVPIPPDATAVHGIRNEDVKDLPPFSKYTHGKDGIAKFFEDCDLAGYNIITFDIPMLKAELERAGEKLDLTHVHVVDAYRIFAMKEERTLSAALQFFCGRPHTGSHAALADVRATMDVLEGELDRYPDLPKDPVGLDQALRHPDAVDRQGKLRWINGEVAIAFGRNKGKTLKDMARKEPEYLRWMLTNEVAPDVEGMLQDALIDLFPAPRKEKIT